MIWRTDKPTEKVIVAKLTEDFCHIKDNYSLLYLADKPYQHYCEYGEEIPYSAIEKWASLEEKKLPDNLEEAVEEYNKQVIEETKCHHNALTYAEGYEDALLLIPDAFIAGAKFDRAKMLEKAVETEVVFRVTGHGLLPAVTFLVDDSYKEGEKVKIIIIPEENLNAIQNEN